MKTTTLDSDTARTTSLFVQRIANQYDMAGDISPLPVWMDEWEHPETYSNPRLLKNIANDGVRL